VKTQPDIACLQELKAPQDNFPKRRFRDAGYGVIWHGQKSYNGVAILARGRDPVETQRGLPGDPNDLHSRYIEASVDLSLSDVSIYPTAIPRRPQVRLQAGMVRAPGDPGSIWSVEIPRWFSPAITM